MEEFDLNQALARVHSVRTKFNYLFEFDSAVSLNATNQMQSSFSKAMLELGLLKAHFQQKFPLVSPSEMNPVVELIDSLLFQLSRQESQYWLALAIVHVTYGTTCSAPL